MARKRKKKKVLTGAAATLAAARGAQAGGAVGRLSKTKAKRGGNVETAVKGG